MLAVAEDVRHSWLRRKLISPVVRLLRRGASPRHLAWSLAVGFLIGINPLIGTTTVLTFAVSSACRLNHVASQIGTHSAYALQLLLLLPFLHAGSVLFHTGPLPLTTDEILRLVKLHPLDLLRTLWTWEWHALVLWVAVAIVITPALAMLLTRVLERTVRKQRTVAA